jgi:hypothetical protein
MLEEHRIRITFLYIGVNRLYAKKGEIIQELLQNGIGIPDIEK